MKRMMIVAIAAALSVILSSPVLASYISDIGYTLLQSELGAATPTGAGIKVAQVEAPINDVSGGAVSIFMPNPSDTEFVGKTITATNGNPSGSFSGHATGVGQLFYGSSRSIASGVTKIDIYEANAWLDSLSASSGSATASLDRVANHSWVGGGEDGPQAGRVLRAVDRQVTVNEYIQVVGLTNGMGNSPLLGGSAYNVISVGRTDGVHQQGSVAVSGDTLYGAGRAVPALVAPQGTTSAATPVVAAAAALLVQTGHQTPALSKGSTTINGVGTIYNAERSETVKAALMAGADRQTVNVSTTADITDYRSAGHETANGLDNRYGAGQVNIYNSYRILAGGEQGSFQSGGADISTFGFDHSTIGGLNGTGKSASYFFRAASEATLSASLVWNLDVSNNALLTTKLYDLDLSLFDVTNGTPVATSASLLDNTENIYFKALVDTRYELRVTTKEPTDFSWDYAVAWRLDGGPSPVPVPPAAWLFTTGIIGLLALARRQSVPR